MKAGKPVEGISGGFRGNFEIKSTPDYLWENLGERAIKDKVKKPLVALRPVCYYGCLVVRPPKVTDAKNHEDPQDMDGILRALGAEVKSWSFKTDCCGGDLTLTRPDLHQRLTQRLLDMALEAGADCIAVACPMCHENLDSRQVEISQQSGKSYCIPVFYFTELMGLAFGNPDVEKWLGRHTVDPRPFLREKGLL